MVMDDRVIISIKQALEPLERGENVVVLLAVESGSRAWGFPSTGGEKGSGVFSGPWRTDLSIGTSRARRSAGGT